MTARGAWVFKVHGGDNPFQEVGVPDLLCCFEGRFIGLEVKLPDEKPSPRQKVILKRIEGAGGIASVVTSVEEVERILQRITRK
jgi:hypothetical protein